jgi:CRP/FNR family transcriptional regulator, cyclic AMP receptor protein
MPELSMFGNSEDTKKYPLGHIFFSVGDKRDVMYVVLSGTVEIVVGDRVVATVGPGEVFGEMAMIDHLARSATARAGTDVEAASIDQRQFLYLVSTHPSFSIEVMSLLAERVRILNKLLG